MTHVGKKSSICFPTRVQMLLLMEALLQYRECQLEPLPKLILKFDSSGRNSLLSWVRKEYFTCLIADIFRKDISIKCLSEYSNSAQEYYPIRKKTLWGGYTKLILTSFTGSTDFGKQKQLPLKTPYRHVTAFPHCSVEDLGTTHTSLHLFPESQYQNYQIAKLITYTLSESLWENS